VRDLIQDLENIEKFSFGAFCLYNHFEINVKVDEENPLREEESFNDEKTEEKFEKDTERTKKEM